MFQWVIEEIKKSSSADGESGKMSKVTLLPWQGSDSV